MSYNSGSFVGDILQLPFAFAGLHYAQSDRDYQRQQDYLNRQMQYDFAQNSIKWRVNDAKQAGIHPLYAMGVSPASAQPVYSSSSSDGMQRAYDNMARSFGQALSNLQLENLSAQTEKTKAETKAIEKNTFGTNIETMADTSAPGSPPSQKKRTIKSSYIDNRDDYKKQQQELASEKVGPAIADAIENSVDNTVPKDKEWDPVMTFLRNMNTYDNMPVHKQVYENFKHWFNNSKAGKALNSLGAGAQCLKAFDRASEQVSPFHPIRSYNALKKAWRECQSIAKAYDVKL